MTDTIDELMDRDPTQMTAENIDALILHYRRQRASIEAGVKPKKEAGPKLELGTLGLAPKAKPVLRRF